MRRGAMNSDQIWTWVATGVVIYLIIGLLIALVGLSEKDAFPQSKRAKVLEFLETVILGPIRYLLNYFGVPI